MDNAKTCTEQWCCTGKYGILINLSCSRDQEILTSMAICGELIQDGFKEELFLRKYVLRNEVHTT